MSFFVTAIAFYPKNPRHNKPFKTTRTFGHFPTLEQARNAVENNDGSMDECLYNFLVIEEIGYGIYASINNEEKDETWYKWEHPKWVPMSKPDWSHGLFGWAM